MRESHLDLLALASRLLKALSTSERPGHVSGVFVDVARNLVRWVFRTALRFEWAYIAVELAGAVQKRLPFMHGATRAKPLSTRAMVDVIGRAYQKLLREKVPSSRFDLSNTGICGAMPFSSTSQFSIGAAP